MIKTKKQITGDPLQDAWMLPRFFTKLLLSANVAEVKSETGLAGWPAGVWDPGCDFSSQHCLVFLPSVHPEWVC